MTGGFMILVNTKSLRSILLAGFGLLFSQHVAAELIGGIEFPDGAASFADAVINFEPGDDVGSDGTNTWLDPTGALGVPDQGEATNSVVALGDGGELILQFTDNSLTTSGDSTPDLHIFEVGAVVETMILAISTNNSDWVDLGSWSGQPTSIDIDEISGVEDGTLYSYIRLRDDASSNQTNFPFGEADIDAVGAISSGEPVNNVPEPSMILLLGSGLLALFGLSGRWKS